MSAVADVLSRAAQWAVLQADSAEVLPLLPRKSVHHVITDPAFSAHVHSRQRRIMTGPHQRFARQRGGEAKDLKYHGNPVEAPLGFDALTPALRQRCGLLFPRLAQRWIVIKTDEESRHLWQADLERGNARHVRAGTWWKAGAQPQLSGRCPAVDREALEIAHVRDGAMRWNGGGSHASWGPYADACLSPFPTYRHAIATDRNRTGERVHPTQTPVALWLDVVEDFTDPGEIILDPFCGSGSLGVACVRLGRRYIGIDNGADEKGKPWAEWAREGIAAETQGLSRGAARAGQLSLLGGGL
jgi:site-specific DNA-methyltransferase (adenine-specific)